MDRLSTYNESVQPQAKTLLFYTVSILRWASVNHFNVKNTSFRKLVFVAYYEKHTHWMVHITPNVWGNMDHSTGVIWTTT